MVCWLGACLVASPPTGHPAARTHAASTAPSTTPARPRPASLQSERGGGPCTAPGGGRDLAMACTHAPQGWPGRSSCASWEGTCENNSVEARTAAMYYCWLPLPPLGHHRPAGRFQLDVRPVPLDPAREQLPLRRWVGVVVYLRLGIRAVPSHLGRGGACRKGTVLGGGGVTWGPAHVAARQGAASNALL